LRRERMTMNKKERYEAIEKACKDFRDENLRTLQNGDHIEMLLPMLYDDNDGACVFITPRSNGFVKVSDGGGTSFHHMLNEKEVEELSERYHLSHGNFYGDEPPFECDLYDVVKLDKIDEAIMGIIMAIQDSYLYVARHNM
jgi:hypothetical protein